MRLKVKFLIPFGTRGGGREGFGISPDLASGTLNTVDSSALIFRLSNAETYGCATGGATLEFIVDLNQTKKGKKK